VFISLVIFAAIGKLLMFLFRKAPYAGYMSRLPKVGQFFKELFACDLCFGCWVFFLMGFVWRLNLLGMQPIPILTEFLDGIIVSFMAWVWSAGWQTLFQNFVITGREDD
jgi:hypothetical protein